MYRLQQIDSQIDWLNARLKEIEEELRQDLAVRLANEKVQRIETERRDTQKLLRVAEDNVKQLQLKIERCESTLYSGKVKNPKELQDLQNEVASHKRYLDVLEERQLEAMVAEEEIDSLYESANNELDKARQQLANKQDKLIKEREKLTKEAARSKDERLAAVSSVEANDLKLYDQLRKKRRGVAVSKVSDRACSACGTTLNSALLYASRSPHQISICDSCGRILYAG
ncbi:zinc ribbon domain-containing protein [Chloroflexota bacterium]